MIPIFYLKPIFLIFSAEYCWNSEVGIRIPNPGPPRDPNLTLEFPIRQIHYQSYEIVHLRQICITRNTTSLVVKFVAMIQVCCVKCVAFLTQICSIYLAYLKNEFILTGASILKSNDDEQMNLH